MGYYINSLPNGQDLGRLGKAEILLNKIEGAKEIPAPDQWQEDLVCVVENVRFDGSFEAAIYAYSPSEMEYFKQDDGRKKKWLIVPGAKNLAK